MTHKSTIIPVSAALLLTLLWGAGCSKQQAVQEPSAGNFPADHVIRVSTEVAPTTKGSYTTDNIAEFDLMVTDVTNSKYSFKNTKFSKISGVWVPEKTLLWGGADDVVTIYAIAPCFKDRDKWVTGSFIRPRMMPFEIEAEQHEESNSSDYLGYILNEKNVKDCLTADGKLKIQFEHMLSLVKITFKLGTEFNNKEVPQSDIISDVVISGTQRSFYPNPAPNPDKFTVQAILSASDVKPYFKKWTPAKDKNGAADKTGNCTSVYECILVPQTVAAGGLKISFKADGKAYEWTNTSDLKFTQSLQHSLTLKVGKDVVIAEGFSAKEWTETEGGKLYTE